uniref:Uncharacterized protein n=1 Tax=viral metagenome TaxID=1070528 RepID=A0A6C0DP02_9ZZZZ
MSTLSIDDEWTQFLMKQNMSGLAYPSISSHTNQNGNIKTIISEERSINTNISKNVCLDGIEPNDDSLVTDVPVCEELYISTKTKVLFLNQEIDIQNIFWKIPIVEYWKPNQGVVKKQMKIVSKTPEEYEEYKQKLNNIGYYTENIIKQIDNVNARKIKFKDERKITVGMSKKDIMNCRGKIKNAFYNCFAIILRFKYEGIFREIHVKVFNTGKLEIPGILNKELLDIVKEMILEIVQPHIIINDGLVDSLDKPNLDFINTDVEDNVLINSNFNCGYFINREKLHAILRSDKYRIESAYDPCSYPGVKCKFYFNNDLGFDIEAQTGQINQEDRNMKLSELNDNKKYTEISFMIFRTGSCLIVGNCSERILKYVFEFIKKILTDEYQIINVKNEEPIIKNKKIKLRKKTILMSKIYYNDNCSK